MNKGRDLVMMVQGGMLPRPSKAEVRRCDLLSRATFLEFLLIRMHIMEALH